MISKELMATLRDHGEWALEMLRIRGPGRSDQFDLRFRKKDGSADSLGVTLSKEELQRMVMSYVEWEDDGNRLEDVSGTILTTRSRLSLRQRIAVLGKTSDEWSKELNIVTFNGGAPKFNVSEWKVDDCRFGKSFSGSEMDAITEVYEATFGPLPRKPEHWWD